MSDIGTIGKDPELKDLDPELQPQSQIRQFTPGGSDWGLNSPNSYNPGHKHTANGVVSLTDAATVASDWSLGNRFRVTLGGNRTLGNPTKAQDGQTAIYEIIQDGTGSRTLAYDTKFAFGTDVTSPTLTTTADKRDFIGVKYNATADKFYVLAVVKGY